MMLSVGQVEAALRKPALRLRGRKRAAVALLLRRRAGGRGALDSAPADELEAFFILRAANESDPWGGHVGLPGGRQERGETDLETVAREVYEEVGLAVPGLNEARFGHLDTSAFRLLGRVDDRKIMQGKNGLVVCAFVFLQVAPETPALVLDDEEVAACAWSPLAQLLEENCGEPLVYSLNHGRLPKESPRVFQVIEALRLDKMFFTKVTLDVEPLYVGFNKDAETGAVRSTSESPIDADNESRIRSAFFLWGLTLGVVNDFLHKQTGLRARRIAVGDKVPVLGVRVERMFDSTVHNVLIALLRSSYERVTSRPMPWGVYVRVYPLAVMFSAVASTAVLARHVGGALRGKL